jgi:diacylglycerol kinase family enzyme|tara:strand:+ start:345 stop:1211 length:867 start_codon:yes stop_codon:yes gene_type:complete
MKKERIFLVNKDSNNSQKVVDYLKSNNVRYYLGHDLERSKIKLREFFDVGHTEFIICGGDGAINKFINEYMKLPKNKREHISLGIIPCGRANDLARALKIPLNVEDSFNVFKKGKTSKVDLVKVNDTYFITGGGIGLPMEIIKDVNKLSKTIRRIVGGTVYFWITLKKFIFGYEGIRISRERFLAIYVLNQPFIGKNFNIAPEAKNNDGLLNAKFVRMPKTFLSKFRTLSKGSNGKIDELEWVKSKETQKLKIQLENSSQFMGDGELLAKGNEFSIELIPNEIKIFTN